MSSTSTSAIQDEGFHEIQLSGKQLVFLFMAATVVSVVIFLLGVLVGRGVRAERVESTAATAAASTAAELTTPRTSPPLTTPAPGSDPSTASAPPPVDELTYFNRLQQSTPAAEKLKASAQPATPVEAPTPPPSPAAKPATLASKTAASASRTAAAAPKPSGAAAGQSYWVQVAALSGRSEADAIAKRLTAKGYGAYVLAPASGSPAVYRVRVGRFGSQREAEAMAAKLRKEEQFKPWVTR